MNGVSQQARRKFLLPQAQLTRFKLGLIQKFREDALQGTRVFDDALGNIHLCRRQRPVHALL